MSVAEEPESLDLAEQAPVASRERIAGLALLAALEAVALVGAAFALTSHAKLRNFLETNGASLRSRQTMVVATVLAGVFAASWVVTATNEPERFAKLRVRLRQLAPLVPLWPAALLLSSNAAQTQPLVLLTLAGVCGLGMERATSWACADLPGWLLVRRRQTPERARIWDVSAAVLTIAFFGWLASRSIRLHHKGLTSNYDLGLFENLFWNTAHGVHGTALGLPYFDQHAELILYPLSLLYRVLPYTETLLVLQAMALAGTCAGLYVLGRRWLGPTPLALVLPLVYASFPAIHGTAFYDFHFLALSPVFLVFAAYAFVARRFRLFGATIAGALLCREDVAVGVAAVSAVLFLAGRERRVTAVVTVVSLVYFVAVKLVWMPAHSFLGYYAALVAPGAKGFGGVALTLVSNPLFVASKVLTEDKLLLALHLLVPTLFLPVRQWRTAFLLLPGLLVVGLAASGTAVAMVHFHYSCHFTPYLFVMATIALAVRPPARRIGAAAGMLVAAFVVSWHFGAFARDPFKASFHEVSFGWTPADAERFARTQAIAATLPPEASVAASEHEGPLVARRRELRAIKDGIAGADYVFYGYRGLAWGGSAEVVAELGSGAVGVVYLDKEYVVLKRGQSAARNAEAMAGLRKAGLSK